MTDTVQPRFSSLLTSVAHGFFGREGGVSSGLYTSLNVGLGTKDDRSAIYENRKRALRAIAPQSELVTLRQVHSAKAIFIDHPIADEDRVEADAMVTDRHGLALGILTADCVPVLFSDSSSGIIGAAHAGWKGAVRGIIEATIDLMVEKGALRQNIEAAVGPAIQQNSYEVDDNFYNKFLEEDFDNKEFFLEGREAHWQFNLPAYVERRLEKAAIGAISRSLLDTCQEDSQFFSYRRACLRGEEDYGRQISIISL
ncbi:MAG: peptidoglycan editing factor PgeF [Zymomonas mobilis subsp. pomaceae]|uniref:Purine nucleoside phosphorylase n=1 Tax=Zymomonas mobilis subsp. pomaceae (strain ATCC 29192 / DSM 22645 / JCM 10191 / CCUG 17912 / NBRC 13757 / NCIMB 11200 / NRRL B-4491 / Barker I) TaxID=579138 RepID=F8EV66_ZYMMT|nr:peptidoglycan editing factor PgeF [Zymomonas mobilis]AEI38284.1 protein of unknown function DUF152 [Zymomonas mobilis subsp. pomaceae ATCC 29192]MDX5947973.1 peptidoglycan editing factor PgeF [Zymomonas mobilis subsp. pomaceae]GEB89302.1 laccase domain protein [Zymomonas mobilis subsp. pomaceae]